MTILSFYMWYSRDPQEVKRLKCLTHLDLTFGGLLPPERSLSVFEVERSIICCVLPVGEDHFSANNVWSLCMKMASVPLSQGCVFQNDVFGEINICILNVTNFLRSKLCQGALHFLFILHIKQVKIIIYIKI